MGAEQSFPNQIDTRRITIPLWPFRLSFREGPFVRRMLELERRIYNAIEVNFPPDAKAEIENIARDNFFIVAYGNHVSHYDGRPMGKATKQILEVANAVLPSDQQYQGFVLPVATSIDTGDQDVTMKKYFEERLKQVMENDKLFTINYTREKDQALYGLPPNLRNFAKAIKQYVRTRHGIAVFPEATVQGGRNRNRRLGIKVHGMQPFEEKTMITMARLVLKEGLIPVFVPFGIQGTNRVYSPDTLKPPTTTIARAIIPGMPRGLVKVNVGMPVVWDKMTGEIESSGADVNEFSVNEFLARKLSVLVPQHARGVYKGTHSYYL